MVYAYAWYEMFGIMLGAGVAIWLVLKGLDLALERLLQGMADRRDRKMLQEENQVPARGAYALRKLRRNDDRG